MTQPLPPVNDFVSEDLPLCLRGNRTRDAEIIRQEFVRSRKLSHGQAADSSANPTASDEQ
jgi:hypothetical protein